MTIADAEVLIDELLEQIRVMREALVYAGPADAMAQAIISDADVLIAEGRRFLGLDPLRAKE